MYCTDISNPFLLLFSKDIPAILYYSHIPALFISFFLSVWILFKKRDITSVLLFILSLLFSIWSIFNLMAWTNNSVSIIMFFWSFFPILYTLLCLFTVYFVLVFLRKKDINFNLKIILFLLTLPIVILTPTSYNIDYFNLIDCGPTENSIFAIYYYVLGFIYLIFMLFYAFSTIKNKNEKNFNLQMGLILMGSGAFLFSFFITGFIASYIYGKYPYLDGVAFNIEQYGLFGMTIFMAFLVYIIVRFKAFNIKLLGAQALVWALIILVGSQFLYQADMPVSSLILTAITLVISAMIGLLVVRSVKKVDHQRELLDIANKNQQSLLHFITHQVKGYLTKSRNIYDGLVAGDYDPISDKAKEMAKVGFASDTKGVETVMAILRASDLKTGKTAFTKEKANVSAIVAEIIESKKESAVQKGLELTFEIEPAVETQVDQLQIKEVFKNLISNSILYTQKGTVHVALKKENGKVKFSVVDTGVGLSPQDKAKLFTEGGKGEEANLVNVDSTGYGLYIAKQIVQQHGGTIEAISEGRGKGSEFFVLLPDIR